MKGVMYSFLSLTFIVVFGVAAYSNTRTNIGCGLGTQIFEGKDGLVSQVCAATTNGSSGNQTFGITSGTLDCEKAKEISSNERVGIFIADNMDNIAKDIAKGNGEYLNTLAVLMEVPENTRSEFYSKLQSNFSHIYTSDEVTSHDVMNNIENVIKEG